MKSNWTATGRLVSRPAATPSCTPETARTSTNDTRTSLRPSAPFQPTRLSTVKSCLDDSGRPDFHALQHFQASATRIHFFVFDVLIWSGHDVTTAPLNERQEFLKSVLKLRSPIRVSEQFDISPDDMISAVRKQGLEGVVAKRKGTPYEPGKRSGSWVKLRINRGQEFVIGEFFPGQHGIDTIVIGYYRGKDLIYVARTINGFVPATRRRVYEKLKPLITDKCPFVNLPETGRARWGEILDAEKMTKCVWVRPKLIAVVEFLEWTEGDRLRHSKFVALREDKNPRDVVKEG